MAGNLRVESVVSTLARMFKQEMLHKVSDTQHLIAQHILAAFKQPNLRFDDAGHFSAWMDRCIIFLLAKGGDCPFVSSLPIRFISLDFLF